MLFGNDGMMERKDAYRMVDEAPPGSVFWRIMLVPIQTARMTARLELPKSTGKNDYVDLWGTLTQTGAMGQAAVHADHQQQPARAYRGDCPWEAFPASTAPDSPAGTQIRGGVGLSGAAA